VAAGAAAFFAGADGCFRCMIADFLLSLNTFRLVVAGFADFGADVEVWPDFGSNVEVRVM
jgi:hypothetical protein